MAATFRALEQFAEVEGYRALGFDRFDQFLNSSRSPLTKSQYYERKALLEAEGDQTFDVLNSLNVPITLRRQVGTGAVRVEGDALIVDDERIALDDRAVVVEVMKMLAARTPKTSAPSRRAKRKSPNSRSGLTR